jgi:hypothetical protein
MAIEGEAVMGVDLAEQVRKALTLSPVARDFIVYRDPVVPEHGGIWTFRLQSVAVVSAVNIPLDASPGTAVGQVTIDVFADVDVTTISNDIPAYPGLLRNIQFRTIIPLHWAGTRVDLLPGFSAADLPAGITNDRNRDQPRLSWAQCWLPDLLKNLPKSLRPEATAPGAVPVASWPDELGLGPAGPATPITHLAVPGGGLGPVANAIGLLTHAVVAQAIALPRVLDASAARGGARRVTIDFQGAHVFATAFPWRSRDAAVDPMPQTRAIVAARGAGWQPGGAWTVPVRVWASPALVRDLVALQWGTDELRDSLADGLVPAHFLPRIGPNGLVARVPWLEWWMRDTEREAPAGTPDVEAWALLQFRQLSGADQITAVTAFLDNARRGFWPRRGELKVDYWEDPDVIIREPTVTLATLDDMREAFAEWIDDPTVPPEPGAPPGMTRKVLPDLPPVSVFFPEQTMAIRVRLRAEAPYWGVENDIDAWFVVGFEPFLNGNLSSLNDADARRTLLGDLLQLGIVVGSVLVGVLATAGVAWLLAAGEFVFIGLGVTYAGAGVIIMGAELAQYAFTGDSKHFDRAFEFSVWNLVLGAKTAVTAKNLHELWRAGMVPSFGWLFGGLALGAYLASLYAVDAWLLPMLEEAEENAVQDFAGGLRSEFDALLAGLTAGLTADAGALDPTWPGDPHLAQRARQLCLVDPALRWSRAAPLLTRASTSPDAGLELAIDAVDVPGVPIQPGTPQPTAAGTFLLEPISVAIGGTSPGILRIDVVQRWDPETSAWLGVALDVSRMHPERAVAAYRLAADSTVTPADFLAKSGSELLGLLVSGSLVPVESLVFETEDFAAGAVCWLLWLDSPGPRFVVGVTTPPAPTGIATADLIERQMTRDLAHAIRDIDFEPVEADWHSGAISRLTLGALTAFPAGTPQQAVGTALVAELTAFALRMGANPWAILPVVQAIPLTRVVHGWWREDLESAFATRLDLLADDDTAQQRMRAWVAKLLVDLAVPAPGPPPFEVLLARQVDALQGWIHKVPPSDAAPVPTHFVRALPPDEALSVRIVGLEATHDGTHVSYEDDSEALTTYFVTTYTNWLLSFRLGLRNVLDVDGALTLTLSLQGAPPLLTLLQVAPMDLAALPVPPGGVLPIDETVTARVTIPFVVPNNVATAGHEEILRVDVTVTDSRGVSRSARIDLPFRQVREGLTPRGRHARALAAAQAARQMSDALPDGFGGAGADLPAFDPARPYSLPVTALVPKNLDRIRAFLDRFPKRPPPRPPAPPT